jgi:YNFM family putative membrane transporter
MRLYTLGFVLMGGFVTMYNYISYLLMGPPYHLSQTMVGFIFLVYVAGTVSSAWMGRLADAMGRPHALRLSLAAALLGVLITLAPSAVIKVAGLACFTFGFFGAHAITSGWVAKLAEGVRAQASSLYLLFYYAGSSVVGTVGGWCWSAGGWPGVAALVLVLYLAGYMLEAGVSRKLRHCAMADGVR